MRPPVPQGGDEIVAHLGINAEQPGRTRHTALKRPPMKILLTTCALLLSVPSLAPAAEPNEIVEGLAFATFYEGVCKPGTSSVEAMEAMIAIGDRYPEQMRHDAMRRLVQDAKQIGIAKFCTALALTLDDKMKAINELVRAGRGGRQ